LALRIAVDLDGVIADTKSALLRQITAVSAATEVERPATPPSARAAGAGSESSRAPTDRLLVSLGIELTSAGAQSLWQRVAGISDFWEMLDESEPGGVSRFAQLASERRWEVIFLTSRPLSAGAITQLQSQRWLERKGYSLPSVYVAHRSRGQIADALGVDVVISGAAAHCLEVVTDSKAKAAWVRREDRQELPDDLRDRGVDVVSTFAGCLELLVALDTPPAPEPGVVARVRRLLGLKRALRV
jgi:hypothetical protein